MCSTTHTTSTTPKYSKRGFTNFFQFPGMFLLASSQDKCLTRKKRTFGQTQFGVEEYCSLLENVYAGLSLQVSLVLIQLWMVLLFSYSPIAQSCPTYIHIESDHNKVYSPCFVQLSFQLLHNAPGDGKDSADAKVTSYVGI